MTVVNKVIDIATAEVGYLEKKNNSNLDSKTANAGQANYTKYARDVDKTDMNNGPKNGYSWCAVFVEWCFLQAFGLVSAKKVLRLPNKSMGAGCGKSQMQAYYSAAGALYTTPQIGDQVFFGEQHTGIVTKVLGNQFWTIEGNTSGGNTVISNGGSVCSKGPYTITSSHKFGRPNWLAVDSNYVAPKNNLAKGSSGNDVKTLQENLNKLGYNCGVADGQFGNNTDTQVRKFQKDNNLIVDGIVGNITLDLIEKLVKEKDEPKVLVPINDGYILPSCKKGDKGPLVAAIQGALYYKGYTTQLGKAGIDGDFGLSTENAIKIFQSKCQLLTDGIVGEQTYKKLFS